MKFSDIIKSKHVVLVEFYASWCPHCQHMMPIVDEVKTTVGASAEIAQFDIDKYRQEADAENVETIPTFILYVDGKEVWRQSGEMTADALVKKIESAI